MMVRLSPLAACAGIVLFGGAQIGSCFASSSAFARSTTPSNAFATRLPRTALSATTAGVEAASIVKRLAQGLRGGAAEAVAGNGGQDLLNRNLVSKTLLKNFRRIFYGSPEAYAAGFKAIRNFGHRGDLTVLAIMVLLPLPLARLLHYLARVLIGEKLLGVKANTYEQSKFSTLGKWSTQWGRMVSFIYAAEIAMAFVIAVLQSYEPRVGILDAAGKARATQAARHMLFLSRIPAVFAASLYGTWIVRKIIFFKDRLLARHAGSIRNELLYTRFMNFLLYMGMVIIVMDSSAMDFGAVLKSIVTVGGLSSVVVGLALTEPASQVVNGALLLAADKFRRNDEVQLGDGTFGKVADIGLMETSIIGGDNIEKRIPNGVVASQAISNISRMRRSQVKLDLRFHLHDVTKVDRILEAIREEIVASCPKLITNGSRPFRVIWLDIAEDHIKVQVNSHYEIAPNSNAYYANREKVLHAVTRAVRKVGVRFAVPAELRGEYIR